MKDPTFCINCYLQPFTYILKRFGINILPSCQEINGGTNNCQRLYYTFLLVIWVLLYFWGIFISLVDEQTSIQYCGGIVYNIRDSYSTIILSKCLLLEILSSLVICLVKIYFQKYSKSQTFEYNYKGEIKNLLKIRKWVQRFVVIFFVSGVVIISIVVDVFIRYIPIPENRLIICSVLYTFFYTWCFGVLLYFIAVIFLMIYFIKLKFENICQACSEFRINLERIENVLIIEERKFVELCEIIKELDDEFSYVLSIAGFSMTKSVACCLYYIMFAPPIDKIFFALFALVLTISYMTVGVTVADIPVKMHLSHLVMIEHT
ncbi:uncharacterized protein LOC111613780 isoform X2 [Centruroides sculpturatus]|uniref:uncharacterized protein LOC111613780 isoform X2 n=1 Tax=Centruroides sculpturatus TaxID=218467 RepID=UPI000C6D7DD0|nr:uncharacterized protein LOC111613780 isoform X2 [Centruroides sculpturatus]